MSVPVYNMTDTWNNGATVFTAILMNVTNTASAAGSLLLDLQLGGNSYFSVDPMGGLAGQILIGRGAGSFVSGINVGNNDLMVVSTGIPIVYFRASRGVSVKADGLAGYTWSSNSNDATSTADTVITRDAAGIVAQRLTTNAQTFRVYNTFTDASNYERGVFDWTTTGNSLTIGTQAAGTGSLRGVQCAGGTWQFNQVFTIFNSGNNGIAFTTSGRVMSPTDNTGTFASGWFQWAGQARVSSDQTFTSNTTLASIASVALQAGRTYSFRAYGSVTGSAGGVQFAMAATGGLTATDIRYDGYVVDNGAAGTKGAAQASALGTAVANPATITGPASAFISGTITVNVAGTLNLQAAQATSSGTSTVIKRGSYIIVQDMP